jgi:hypothetical protein
VFQQLGALRNSLRRLPVKPSAQPTLVRTQHLPPHITPAQPVCGQIIAAGCRGCEPIWAGARASSGGVVFGQVRALRSDPAGICGPGALIGAVEWCLSESRDAAGHRRGREVVAALACRFLRIRSRHMGTGGARFSTAPLTVPRPLPQASVQPSPPPGAAQRPMPGWHDARRPVTVRTVASEPVSCSPARGPGKHRHREADATLAPRKPPVRAARKAA